MKFVATKKGMTKKKFRPSLLLLFLDPGSGMDKNQDPESGINIPDPQHCILTYAFLIRRHGEGGVAERAGSHPGERRHPDPAGVLPAHTPGASFRIPAHRTPGTPVLYPMFLFISKQNFKGLSHEIG